MQLKNFKMHNRSFKFDHSTRKSCLNYFDRISCIVSLATIHLNFIIIVWFISCCWIHAANAHTDLTNNTDEVKPYYSLFSHCSKCSNGSSLTSLLIQEPTINCGSGHFFPILINDQCNCDLVCAIAPHQPCHLVYQNQSLCDSSLKLKCNEKTKLCEGQLSLSFDNVTQDSFEIYWSSQNQNVTLMTVFIAEYLPQISNVNFRLVKYPIKKLNKHRLNTRIDNLEVNKTYLVKVIDKNNNKEVEELTIARTREIQKTEALPKVLVTHRNATSITIVFDDFKPSVEDSGYEIHYQPLNNEALKDQWLIIKSNGTPSFTLTALKPNSRYRIQVFTWGSSDHRQGLNSEIIEAQTLQGCVYKNQTYDIDTKTREDCEKVCFCTKNETVICNDRCLPPFFPVTSVFNDPNIKCLPHPNDNCCVQCFNETHDDFIGKPGICPELEHNDNYCVDDCAHDYHCTGVRKCCKNNCGSTSCLFPANSFINQFDCPLKCDENSQCKFIEEESSYRCVCLNGLDSMNGCLPKPSSQNHLCFFKNETFFVGQTFEHECQVCLCSESLEIECKQKSCAFDLNSTLFSKHCKLVEDQEDPKCCRKKICDSDENHLNKTYSFGCTHLNHTYNVSETFYIGCELKCVCKLNEEIECTPRCSEQTGYNESFCRLSPDPKDLECCKISICYNSSDAVQEHKLLIEMAESFNSTSMKFRIVFNSPVREKLFIFYSKVLPNVTEKDQLLWLNKEVSSKMLLNSSQEIFLSNLEPETDYSIYFKILNETSNTVIVCTFPHGIDHTFKGCFHGSQIIEVGEVFYEGECEYKCICKEGGIRECVERCPIFVDLVALRNCEWITSSEDSCCKIPVCENDLYFGKCSSEDGRHFKIGDTWSLGIGCLKKTCSCIMNKNNMTETKCKGGCPQIPSSALIPNPTCPSPQLIRTKDPCACPYVVCSNNINPLDLPEKMIPHTSKNYCEFKGNRINIGEEFYDGCRAICLCDESSRLDCRPIQCNHNFGPHTTKCLEWEIDPHFIPRPPNCCPEPICKNDGSCSFAGIRFSNFKQIPQELLPCEKRCDCRNGKVNCENICPSISETPPKNLPCLPSKAFRGHLPGDSCCIHWQCREVFQDKIHGKCRYQNKNYKLGEQWDDFSSEIKRSCHCKVTGGILHVVCNPGECQPITERFLEPTAQCRVPTVVSPKDAIMCPYVICNNTGPQGEELENVDIVAINSTSARVRFTLPKIYVGLLGHAEVHYTTDINIFREQWNIQKFARPKRLFDIPNIEYHLGNLKPDTTYFLQIEIIIETLKASLISEIYKLYLPPMPKTSSTTTTTTTSTLPPIIMLDMHLSVDNIDSTTLKIIWRPFTNQEKKFIDGLQVRYKKTNQNNDDWSYSQILHRNSNFFMLRNLEPGVTYVIDLVFVSIDGINTNIKSSKPLLVDMPLSSKQDSHFEIHISPADVTVENDQVNIRLRNLPKPVKKYINLAKIQCQNTQNSELLYNFVSLDDSGQIAFNRLASNTRYKIWIDFYLTNGQVVSSNSIDILTNFETNTSLIEKKTNQLMGYHQNHLMNLNEPKYQMGLTILSLVMFFTGTIFLFVTCVCIRKQSTAAITRASISEAAYDNPTYKTFETGNSKFTVNDDSVSK